MPSRPCSARATPRGALLLLGEQPGDQEDRQGRPFVGPAGKVLERAPADAGIHPDGTYVTNAVKHFKHRPQGRKRRIHKSPSLREMTACRPWLVAELAAVRPRVVVALGAVAARSLVGRTVSIGPSRGSAWEVAGRPLVVTYHPSAVLRANERAADIRSALVEDLVSARELAAR